MKLRCPECSSAEADSLTEPGSRIECDNCGAEFAREGALITVAEGERDLRRAGPPQELFTLDRRRAAFDLRNLEGAVSPVSPHSDADGLNALVDDALFARVIRRARPDVCLAIYPLSLSDPEPILAVNPSSGPTLLGWSLKLQQHNGENPVDFTVRVLDQIVEQANALAGSYQADSARLDRIASYMNRPGPWNGGDVCEVVASELQESGRELVENADELEPAARIAAIAS